jgi:hypothetical protein
MHGTRYENGFPRVIYTTNFSVMAASFLWEQKSDAILPVFQNGNVLRHTANRLRVTRSIISTYATIIYYQFKARYTTTKKPCITTFSFRYSVQH